MRAIFVSAPRSQNVSELLFGGFVHFSLSLLIMEVAIIFGAFVSISDVIFALVAQHVTST